jgi:PhzF family phenazine biosynthesis protein
MSTADPTTRVLHFAAFPDSADGGNLAGVVLDASRLSDAERLQIAADLGYSESAFVIPTDDPDRFEVRYFSPLAEVPFCGHATIATAVALAARDGVRAMEFQTRVGLIPMGTALVDGEVVATLTSSPSSTRPAERDELSRALAALGWTVDDLDDRYPAHVANAGNDHLVLAVRERAVLAGLDYDYPQLAELMAQRQWITAQLVWAETPVLFHARDPFPPGGVVEDPATGAAAAALGGYLRALDLVPVPSTVTILQGQDMGRPSRLVVGIRSEDSRITVTGTARAVSGG